MEEEPAEEARSGSAGGPGSPRPRPRKPRRKRQPKSRPRKRPKNRRRKQRRRRRPSRRRPQEKGEEEQEAPPLAGRGPGQNCKPGGPSREWGAFFFGGGRVPGWSRLGSRGEFRNGTEGMPEGKRAAVSARQLLPKKASADRITAVCYGQWSRYGGCAGARNRT